MFAFILECITISWIYDAERFNRNIQMMIGKSIPFIIRISWCLVTPFVMLALFLATCAAYSPPYSANYTYPDFAIAIGQFFAILPMLPVPIVIIWELVHSKGTFLQRIKTLARPDSSWGPNSKRHRQTYKVYEYRKGLVDRIRVNLLGDRHCQGR
uniref:Sodium-and chloride-dependent betaine transporter n=1 Tax=Magallana gigas TaxID=29159 RepID=K1PND4_MAGGI